MLMKRKGRGPLHFQSPAGKKLPGNWPKMLHAGEGKPFHPSGLKTGMK
jgi:hypothetical protein